MIIICLVPPDNEVYEETSASGLETGSASDTGSGEILADTWIQRISVLQASIPYKERKRPQLKLH